MVEKKFGVDFTSSGGALTLEVSEVSDLSPESGTHTKTHSDGWSITGEVYEDYYTWVNDFTAIHPDLGKVQGNFEGTVSADTEEGFRDFFSKHPPQAWDYRDI